MTSIDPSQQLLWLLRARMGKVRAGSGAQGASSRSGAPAAGAADTAAVHMAQRIGAISLDDPDRRRKAVRVYLESELAREFGAGVLNDPTFPHMLDSVQQQMAQDAQMAQAVHALGDLLMAGGGAGQPPPATA